MPAKQKGEFSVAFRVHLPEFAQKSEVVRVAGSGDFSPLDGCANSTPRFPFVQAVAKTAALGVPCDLREEPPEFRKLYVRKAKGSEPGGIGDPTSLPDVDEDDFARRVSPSPEFSAEVPDRKGKVRPKCPQKRGLSHPRRSGEDEDLAGKVGAKLGERFSGAHAPRKRRVARTPVDARKRGEFLPFGRIEEVYLVPEEDRLEAGVLYVNEEAVEVREVDLGMPKGSNYEHGIHVGHRRTDEFALAREDLVQDALSVARRLNEGEIPYEGRNPELSQTAPGARAEEGASGNPGVPGGRGLPLLFLDGHVVVARQSTNDASPQERLLQNLPPFLNRPAHE